MHAGIKVIAALLLTTLLGISEVIADVAVKGYYRKDGTYVAPHMRSSPNGSTSDNWSTYGNVNPYTGKAGTRPTTASVIPLPTTSEAPGAAPLATQLSALGIGSAASTLTAAAPVSRSDLEGRISLLEAKIERIEALLAGRVAQSQSRQSATPIGAPTLEQWRQVKIYMPMGAVDRVLGKPKKITNGGLGERWDYEGGGWVRFYSSQMGEAFGGYSYWPSPSTGLSKSMPLRMSSRAPERSP
jgi:hypothetical protein